MEKIIGLSRDKTVVDDLTDIFNSLGRDTKKSFKEGIKNALSRCLVESVDSLPGIIDSLLILAQKIHSVDALAEIEKLVLPEALNKIPERDRESVFARAMETVIEYRGYEDVARIILKRFAPNVLFRKGYSLKALVACILSDKSQWANAFGAFRLRLAGSRVKLRPEVEREIREKIDPDWVRRAEKLGAFHLVCENGYGFGSDDWFLGIFGFRALQKNAAQICISASASNDEHFQAAITDVRELFDALTTSSGPISFPCLTPLRNGNAGVKYANA